ncbi:hypothetical protein TWF730_005990 [Orbilia blumenaviensis]|uniref:Uncharacterized protein n=1 Tax=Orbilia blumenaviensis TaxID=1796055 RepID=A0AAV9VM82_9PEZI
MPSIFSCLGGIFKRRKNKKTSNPAETTPEGPRPSRRHASRNILPSSIKVPAASAVGAQASGPRSPNLVYSNNHSRGSIVSRRPNVTNSNPTISVTTPGASSFPLTSPQVPHFFTKSSTSSKEEELEISYLADEKKNSSSSEFTRAGTFDFDATPRFHRIFKILSPPATKLTFTEAVRPEPEPAVEERKSMASRISKRLSRRWPNKAVDSDCDNIHPIPSPVPSPSPSPQQMPQMQMCSNPQYLIFASYGAPQSPHVYTTPLSPPPIPCLPPSARNGLGQCLTTRLPNGETKPVTMVPQLKLSVPMVPRMPAMESTPIEASPVCDPWRHKMEEIDGMSDRHQAWML